MTTLKMWDINIVALIILVFIFINANNRSDKAFVLNRLFLALLKINILMILIEIFGWVFNELPGFANLVLNNGFNVLLYILAPLAPSIWALYVHYQIFSDESRLEKIKRHLLIPFICSGIVSILSVVTGWFFYVDAQNIYHRGSYFWIYVLYIYGLFIYSLLLILLSKKRLDKKNYYYLMLFYLPPVIGTLIQTFCYGTSYNWIGMMLSLLIIYFYLQDRGLITDYLTGAYNRRQLDGYVKAKVKNSPEKSAFSAIMFDLDHFKEINDTYGHDKGDEALKDAVTIIRKCLRQNDFVARVGGDEFVAILDIQSEELLKQAVNRICDALCAFNAKNDRLYDLSFSMGYATYDAQSYANLEDFFRKIDKLMYQDKKTKQQMKAE